MTKGSSNGLRKLGLFLIFVPLIIFVILFTLSVFFRMSLDTAETIGDIMTSSTIFLLDFVLLLTTIFGVPCFVGGLILWLSNRR